MSLTNKIDFAIVFTAKNANPNGDPLNGNRPRTTYDGYGEVSDVCLKRKLRNRLQDLEEPIFVQSDDKRTDRFRSLKDRYDANEEIKKIGRNKNKKEKEEENERKEEGIAEIACKAWYDVRSFGQVFAFEKQGGDDAVSIGVRGPVSIQSAFSVSPVDVSSLQITKSVNRKTEKNPDKKGSDTMGLKHRVDFGTYVTYGSINCQLAEKTGFSDKDANQLLEALKTLFDNDMSSARPEGSMEVIEVVWWKHKCKTGQYSSKKVHDSLRVEQTEKGEVSINLLKLQDLETEVYKIGETGLLELESA